MSIVAVSQELDPYVAPNLETAELSWIYADGLTGSDLSRPQERSVCVRPPLLRTFGPSATPSFDYELRRGVRWHDGKPLVAADVASCFHRLRTTPWGHERPFSLVTRIDAHDDHRFTVHLSESDPRFPLAFFSPFGSPGIPLVRPGPVPLGTGPFRIAGRGADFVSYQSWQWSPRGAAGVTRMRLRYLANEDTQNVMLESGETDVALFVSHDTVIRQKIPYFRRPSGVAYLVLNANGALDTPELRAGFSAAVDPRVVAQKIYKGWSPAYHSVVAPGVAGAHIPLARPYDPAFARKTLAARREPIQLVTYTDAEPIVLFQDQLRRCGIRSSVKTYPIQQFLAPGGPMRSGRFDVALFGEYFSLDPDLEANWGCASIPPRGGNFSRLCDPRLDALARADDLPGALRQLGAQHVVVPLVRSVQCIGLSRRLRGASQPPDLVSSVFQCARWSLS
jgi:ABC-type transport system substrate-binding protein